MHQNGGHWSSQARGRACYQKLRGQSPRHRPVQSPADPPSPEAGAGDVVEAIRLAVENRLRSTNPTTNGWADTLCHVARGETCGIAGYECIVPAYDVDPSAEEITVARGLIM